MRCLIFLAALAASAAASAQTRGQIIASGVSPWILCVKETASAWSKQPEAADVIARGAVAHCASFEGAARDAFKRALMADGVGENQALADARVLVDKTRSEWVERAIAVVIDARVVRSR